MIKMKYGQFGNITIDAKGKPTTLSKEVIILMQSYYEELKEKDEVQAEAFRTCVGRWAEGKYDD